MRALFIHGWAFSSKVFTSLHGIKYDLPAHGTNGEPYRSMEETVESIALRLPGKHDVVGWSLGGSVAILLALRFPSKVRRLILLGTSPCFGRAWSEKNLRAFRLMVRRRGASAFREMVTDGFEDYVEEGSALRMLDDYIALDLRPLIPLIEKEVFILQGERDQIVPVREAFTLHNLFKRSKLIILPGGHFPAEDEKAAVSALLKSG